MLKGQQQSKVAPAGQHRKTVPLSEAGENRSSLRIRQSDEQLWTEANGGYHNYHGCLRNAIKDYVRRAGAALNRLKARVGRGNWEASLKSNFHGSSETANVYMRVARRWGEIEAAGLDKKDDVTLEEIKRFLAKPKEPSSIICKPKPRKGGGVAPNPPPFRDFAFRLSSKRATALDKWLQEGKRSLQTDDIGNVIYEAMMWRWEIGTND
jgi:hypothetical protein